jgi:hypothetical protein
MFQVGHDESIDKTYIHLKDIVDLLRLICLYLFNHVILVDFI